jgi:hypothetical protein
VVLQHGHFGKWIRNILKVLKCAGKGWKQADRLREKWKVLHSQDEDEYPTYNKQKEG